MLSQISWSQYFLFIAVVAITYYFIIIIYFYRSEFIRFLSRFTNTTGLHGKGETRINFTERRADLNEDKEQNDDTLRLLAKNLLDELKPFLPQAGKRNLAKEEILFGVKLILKKYPDIKETAFQAAINNFIETQCEMHCSIILSEQEIKALWKE